MAKRRRKVLYDAYPERKQALKLQNSLNLATNVGYDPSCPGGAGAIVRRLRPAQDGGRLKWGVYVNSACRKI